MLCGAKTIIITIICKNVDKALYLLQVFSENTNNDYLYPQFLYLMGKYITRHFRKY